jgi:hypothetical protein
MRPTKASCHNARELHNKRPRLDPVCCHNHADVHPTWQMSHSRIEASAMNLCDVCWTGAIANKKVVYCVNNLTPWQKKQ